MQMLKCRAATWLCAGVLVLSCGRVKTEEKSQAEQGRRGEQPQGQKEVRISREALSSIQLQMTAVEKRAMGAVIHATAVIKLNSDRVTHITPRIPGRVAQTFIALGQRVRKGDRLVVLDSVELGEAKLAYRKAKAQLEVTKSTYEREKRLYEDGRITSEKEMLDAKGAYLESRAEFEAAEERLRLYGLSQDEIDQTGVGHNPEASLLPVVSPLSGAVIEKHVTLGEVVRPDEAICTVADLSTLWIVLNVYEKDLARVRVGQEVSVQVDAFPGKTFSGALTYIGAVLDETTRTAEARVEIDNASGDLKPGMFATVTLQTGSLVDVIAVPSKAIQTEGETQFVFVALDDSAFAKRTVKPGSQFNEWIEIIDGLKTGERVVTDGSFFLKSELTKAALGED